jgi:glycosyltransferase involved in cell wall biosynthesis
MSNNNIPSLTAIVLTFNEEIHLQRCLNSLKNVCSHIIVIDSFSKDSTKKIAEINNVTFCENPWVNYAAQFNWALDNCDITTDWVLRMDADEYLMPDLQNEILEKLNTIQEPINGVDLYLRRVFLGRHMKRGLGKIKMMRLFRYRKARIENRWMDEHAELLEGTSIVFNGEFADDNLNTIGWWTIKHNGYAIREAIDLLDIEYNLFGIERTDNLSEQAMQKRNLKLKYSKLPLFLRCFVYFVFRYIFRFGFLDGKEGFLWHFLQGWWYRTLVDAKIYEIKKHCGNDVVKIREYTKNVYKIEL